MDTASPEKILEALELMGSRLGVVSTVGEDGSPESAVVYFYSDKELNIYFMTQTDNRKYKDIMRNPNVAFTVFSEEPPRTLQIKGRAEPIADQKEREECLNHLKSLATKVNPLPPISQIKELHNKSDVAVVKITPSWTRLGDFDIYREHNMFANTN